MAQVLAAVPVHGLEPVLVAVELALESGAPSAEHVLNVLARLKDDPPRLQLPATRPRWCCARSRCADVQRYDRLLAPEVGHE